MYLKMIDLICAMIVLCGFLTIATIGKGSPVSDFSMACLGFAFVGFVASLSHGVFHNSMAVVAIPAAISFILFLAVSAMVAL